MDCIWFNGYLKWIYDWNINYNSCDSMFNILRHGSIHHLGCTGEVYVRLRKDMSGASRFYDKSFLGHSKWCIDIVLTFQFLHPWQLWTPSSILVNCLNFTHSNSSVWILTWPRNAKTLINRKVLNPIREFHDVTLTIQKQASKKHVWNVSQ